MVIIGLTGTLGAGKGTVVNYLVSKKGFAHYSVREFIVKEIQKKGFPVNRDSMTTVGNEMRRMNTPSFIIDELYKAAAQSGNNCVIESIRTTGEVESLRKKPEFYFFAVDADPFIRYARIIARNSETDRIDFMTFIANEQREMESTDPNKQNLRRCIELADQVFENNGTIAALEHQVEKALQRISENYSKDNII